MKIGIVLTNVSEDKIEGALVDCKVVVGLDELHKLEVRQELNQFPFELDLKTGIYETAIFCDIEMSQKIGRKLKKIGFKNVKLLFNGEIHEVKDIE